MTPSPDQYLESIRQRVPRYEELQAAAVDAVPGTPGRILELGFGTAETSQRLLDRFPETRITGLDSSADMVFAARELGWEDLRLGRIEDPLPDGPWDLVIAVLTIAELDEAGIRDLFRRVKDHSRAVVIADVADSELAETWAGWCGGEVAWQEDGLAVIRAVYG
jgi:tRNA (cmo5U34)-methyltransferase